MNKKEIQEKIRERGLLQRERNAVLREFSDIDPQKIGSNPTALMGILPKLPALKDAFSRSQQIESLSDEIIAGFIRLNIEGKVDG